ncbi:MAG: hypothetical protein JNM14_03900 [Ferruginibacter sp.]|nr:hypothetical protein [Ferruginibacter sp.]
MENMHIIFWLLKDISWCMVWKPLGIAMIFPTLVIAIIISIKNRKYVSEVCHNWAIVFWIAANSYWMISEFFSFDKLPVYAGIEYKYIAIIPFVIGILILAYYYLVFKVIYKKKAETM